MIVSLYHEQKGLYLNLMAVMHGLGSTLAPLFASWLFGLGVSWREVYRWDFLLIGILLLFSMLLRFPKPEEKSSLDFRTIPQTAFRNHLPLFYAAMTFYVAAEIGLASWLVVYLQDARAVSVSTSNQALALFFGALMLGRFLGGFIVHRLGYLRSVFLAASFAVLSLAIGIFTEMLIFIPLTGFFFSIIFPTLTAAVSDEHHRNLNTILGVLFTFSGLGGMLGPWLVAWSSDLLGLQIGFMATFLLAALTLLSTFILFRKNSHGQSA
ncbi:MAG: MFS transporter [Chloroflexi bacterium]|nr:MFS transporter [Chloroflexota bacterium]